ncbi:MAG: carboxymuconolactone decarboxylase family protein [Myxococcales bacterium]|nr:carboxymuconolactone decarboxylase family protein [Myxococcales bacterium]
MARLPLVDAATAPDPVREALERVPVQLNIFRMMAHAETCFRPLMRLGAAILGRQKLDPRLRELAILDIAQRSGSDYEWTQHDPIGRAMGITAAQMAALARGDIEAECFDDVDRLVLRFTVEVVERVKASDAVFAEMRRHFSPQEIVELILAIGFYMTVARLLETTEVDQDPPAGTKIVEAAS